ncbi:CrcB family protein [Kingella negevensis]|uniref:CrcB family protein n=1 Tax=Kingella negevensis TaxID=1522312 RepID=UPI002542F0E7|nr:CrcB family protein [Kingella negevensis]WII93329.1 CrcB family protein [Kingella negevensis]
MMNVLAIALGAVGGALLRWRLGAWLNGSLNALPLGTLVANLVGCFLIGVALAFRLPEFWKLLIVTGFLGSLTTFSTFSAELVAQVEQEKWGGLVAMLGLHIGGGVCVMALGAMFVKIILKSLA